MDWWMWLILGLYLLIGFMKTGARMGAGMRGTSFWGTLIFGTLLWPFL